MVEKTDTTISFADRYERLVPATFDYPSVAAVIDHDTGAFACSGGGVGIPQHNGGVLTRWNKGGYLRIN